MVIKKENNLVKVAILFYICSVVGYIYEMVFCFIHNGKFISHGILYGPWLPIYGIGAVFISLLNKWRHHPFLIFIISFFITSILEYICGFLLLNFFDLRLWDYRNWFFNINGFVSLFSSIGFAIGGLLIIYGFMPLINMIVKKTNNNYCIAIINILTTLFLIDILFTIIA